MEWEEQLFGQGAEADEDKELTWFGFVETGGFVPEAGARAGGGWRGTFLQAEIVRFPVVKRRNLFKRGPCSLSGSLVVGTGPQAPGVG